MNKQILTETIQQLFSGAKGLLAMDESNLTCDKRFADALIKTGIIPKSQPLHACIQTFMPSHVRCFMPVSRYCPNY